MQDTELIKALKGIRSTLGFIAFWLFLIAMQM
jgi:hypothetical protein